MAGILNFLISNGGTGGVKPQNVSGQGGIMRIVQGFPLEFIIKTNRYISSYLTSVPVKLS